MSMIAEMEGLQIGKSKAARNDDHWPVHERIKRFDGVGGLINTLPISERSITLPLK